eukprot:9483308-Pyramimonas_sp.AAC.4
MLPACDGSVVRIGGTHARNGVHVVADDVHDGGDPFLFLRDDLLLHLLYGRQLVQALRRVLYCNGAVCRPRLQQIARVDTFVVRIQEPRKYSSLTATNTLRSAELEQATHDARGGGTFQQGNKSREGMGNIPAEQPVT